MSIKVLNDNLLNFDIPRLNLSNFTFKMTNLLIGPKLIVSFIYKYDEDKKKEK